MIIIIIIIIIVKNQLYLSVGRYNGVYWVLCHAGLHSHLLV